MLNQKGTNLFVKAGDMCLLYVKALRQSCYLIGNLQQGPGTLAHPDLFPNISLEYILKRFPNYSRSLVTHSTSVKDHIPEGKMII